MQRAETTDVHPGLRIEDHERRSPFSLVYLAVDEPKGDLAQDGNDLDTPTDLHVRSYAERHVRSYADSWASRPVISASTRGAQQLLGFHRCVLAVTNSSGELADGGELEPLESGGQVGGQRRDGACDHDVPPLSTA